MWTQQAVWKTPVYIRQPCNLFQANNLYYPAVTRAVNYWSLPVSLFCVTGEEIYSHGADLYMYTPLGNTTGLAGARGYCGIEIVSICLTIVSHRLHWEANKCWEYITIWLSYLL